MAGILYGAGVGPGDPEYMTLKVIRLIRENDVFAMPGEVAKETAAYKVAVQIVPELAEKELIAVSAFRGGTPEEMDQHYEQVSDQLETYLKSGRNVVYMTMGDPSIYSSYPIVQKKLEARGYQTRLTSGVPAFCMAAACVNRSLVEWEEELHVIPSAHESEDDLNYRGTSVLMMFGNDLKGIKDRLRKNGQDVVMISNGGMDHEKIYHGLDEIPDTTGQYSLIIAKEKKQG